jgi:MTH538 TIR-like domain (DUF1863)
MESLTRTNTRSSARAEAASAATLRYVGFLSYSHADEAIGDWLHRRLEAYAVPAALVGRAGPDGPIGKRLGRVFRDRADLSTSDDLGREIRRALEAAGALIVLCSPRSARSPYVHEEIRYFKELGKSQRILAAIVDGEPHAAAKPGHTADEECFPRALLNRLDADGRVSDTPEATEPIAADFREGKDGHEGAAMKLIAGLLGLGLDELVQREKQAERKRRRRANTIAVVMSVLAAGALAAGGVALWQRNVAEHNATVATQAREEAEAEQRRAETQQRRAETQQRRAEAEQRRAEAQRQLAVGRSLAVTAQELAKEEGDVQRDLLAALVVEAIKRIPPEEASMLAAIVAVRLGQDIALDAAQGGELDVQFVSGKDVLGAVGFATGLHLLDLARGFIRTVDKKHLGATERSAPLSSFGHRDASGRYLAVESGAGVTYIVDTGSLRVTAIPADWSIRFSDDSRFGASVVTDYESDRIKLVTFRLPGFERQDLVLGEDKEGPYTLQYFDGRVALFDRGGSLVVRSNGEQREFAVAGGWEIRMVASNRRHAYLALNKVETVDFQDSPLLPLGFTDSSFEQGTEAPGHDAAIVPAPPLPGERQQAFPLELAKDAAPGVYRLNWDSGALAPVLQVPNPLAVQLSADKMRLIVHGGDRICWRSLASDHVRCVPLSDRSERCGRIGCRDISSNARWLAVEIESGWQLADLRDGRGWTVTQEDPEAAFLPPASPLALLVGSRDLVIVDLASQQIRARLAGWVKARRVALNDKGDLLALGGGGMVRVARLAPGALLAHLCRQPGRNLDKVQWKRYLGDQAWQASCPGWK